MATQLSNKSLLEWNWRSTARGRSRDRQTDRQTDDIEYCMAWHDVTFIAHFHASPRPVRNEFFRPHYCIFQQENTIWTSVSLHHRTQSQKYGVL